MNKFAALLDRLAYEPGRNDKLRLIADYLRTTPDPERGWALAALTGALSFQHAKARVIRALMRSVPIRCCSICPTITSAISPRRWRFCGRPIRPAKPNADTVAVRRGRNAVDARQGAASGAARPLA